MTSTDEIVMYLVVRKDLKMNAGKVGAQCGHAVQLTLDQLAEDDWLRSWKNGSYTKIALAVQSLEELQVIHQKLMAADLLSVLVVDEGRTQVEQNTVTVLGIRPLPKSIASTFVGHLPLYR